MWSLKKVADVRGHTVSAVLHPKLLPEAVVLEREQLAKRLIETIRRDCDAEVSVMDVAFGVRSEREGVLHRCWWRPLTDVVELTGGPADGVCRQVQVPGAMLQLDDGHATYFYHRIGWDPEHRRWVYGVQAPQA